jgi:hypothetical protein
MKLFLRQALHGSAEGSHVDRRTIDDCYQRIHHYSSLS